MKTTFKILSLIWQFVIALTVLSFWDAPEWAYWILYGIVAVIGVAILVLFVTALCAAVKMIMSYVALELAEEKSKKKNDEQHQDNSQQSPGVDEGQ